MYRMYRAHFKSECNYVATFHFSKIAFCRIQILYISAVGTLKIQSKKKKINILLSKKKSFNICKILRKNK